MAEQESIRFIIDAQNRSTRAFNDVKKSLSDLSGGLAVAKRAFAAIVPIAIVTGIANQFRALFSEISVLDDMAEKTGAAVENLSRLQQVAKIGSHDFQGFTDVMVKFSRALSGADEESKGAGAALAAINLKAEELRNIDPGTAIEILAKRLNEYKDSGSKAALVSDLLGRGAAQYLPMFKDIAETMGISAKVTKEQASAAEILDKELKKLSLEFSNSKRVILNDFVPAYTEIVKNFRAAYEAGGLLSGMLANISTLWKLAFKGTDATIAKKELQAVEEQIAGINNQLESGTFNPKESKRFFSKRLSNEELQSLNVELYQLTARREELRKQLEAPIEIEKPTIEYTKPSGGSASKFKELDEAELRIKLNRAMLEANLSIEKEINKQRLQALEAYNSQGLLSIREYYKSRSEITRQGLSDELKAIDDQIKDQKTKYDEAQRQKKSAVTSRDQDRINEETKKAHDATEQLIKLEAERIKVQAAASGEAIQDAFQEREAVEQLRKSYEELLISIRELRGDEIGAALARFDAQNKKLVESFSRNADVIPGGTQAIADLRDLTESQLQFNKAKQTFSEIESRLRIDEERIQNSQRTGAIGEFESLNRLSDKRKAAVLEMREQIVAMERVAAGSNNNALKLQLEELKLQMESLGLETNLLADKFNTVLSDAFGNAFNDFISGAKSAKDAFKSFANAVVSDINRMISNNLYKSLFGISGNGGGGAGGLLAELFSNSNLSGIKGVKAGSQQDRMLAEQTGSGADRFISGLSSAANDLVSWFKDILPFAEGGSFAGGQMALVGERGPELVRFNSPGRVYSHAESKRMISASSPRSAPVINQYFTFQGATDRRSQAQAAAAAGDGLQRIMARYR